MVDPRRHVPRTDVVLADPRLAAATERAGRAAVKSAVVATLQRVRDGALKPDDVVDAALAALPGGLRPVLNATGVVLHTNLGRAALSPAAREAVVAAAGHTDVELDLGTGRRAKRGRTALAALQQAVPAAGDVHVVNNGAAALVLAATALAGGGREIIVSRGEMVEIGDGFRLPDLLESTGARLREVGTTNRTALADYERAIGPSTGFVLKVHPSNFVVRGFTSAVPISALSGLGTPVVADIGSGLLEPDPLLPGEPDAATTLAEGADLVIASGDKLLGGPQAGLLLGSAPLINQLRRHPLARALRVDKLTLAALQATLTGPSTPTWDALRVSPAALRARTAQVLARLTGADISVELVASDAVVGGGGAPEVTLPSWSLSLPSEYAAPLRAAPTPVVGRVDRGRLLLDLRCVPSDADSVLTDMVIAVAAQLRSATGSALPTGPVD
ncbi:L-seryl-tRNA(Sec) selenium transferase [Paractinoplanes abujensis]|uniref:L-seryl-tRNA(Sec) selenium transferase n=1 Tax=Paractinoplanes abujensis TaxID=882441 RepID=A0A7W7CKD7_9ACTN|nr:L-seryl-tRNA(Sec) selenium transferase [Actinoplanes abujensis]MBB4690179.1 L-seryl-tRNA(Ser) seleniumtransferase [Actinoplanes abujensis]GID20946.1 L-seryl-tRNA(Sec) selenium transferase [Actinoplanes abujensis]